MITYRVGNHQAQNIYRDDTYIGVMFDPIDAAAVVRHMNAGVGECTCNSYEPCSGQCCGVGMCSCSPAVPTSETLNERRQRAREAGLDLIGAGGFSPSVLAAAGIEAGIETATRVRITSSVILAFIEAPDGDTEDDIAGPLRAAFRAAGFEVEE